MTKNSMLKFTVKLLAVITVVALSVSVINYFYVNGVYYKDVYGEVAVMNDVPSGLKLVNFGTSHGLASFRYDETDKTAFNFALSGSDLYHNFQTLKQFTPNLAEGCIVAIPVSYFSFCMSTEEPTQKRYYCYLDKEYIRDFSYETLLSAKYFPVLRSGEFIIKDLIKDQEHDVGAVMMGDDDTAADSAPSASISPADSVAEDVAPNDSEAIEALYSHASGRVESWRAGHMTAGRKYIADNTAILTEMVNYCYEHGFKPVLVSTPIYKALNEEFTKEELAVCYFDNMNAVVKSTGVPYLDCSHDAVLSENPNYYGNSDHLSEEGGAAFMQRYEAYLLQIGYLN